MALLKKVEVMKLRYEKVISSFVFKEPTRNIQENYITIDKQVKQLEKCMQIKQEREQTRYGKLIAQLDAYSPLKTLARGYVIAQKEGKVIKTKTALKSGDEIELRFVDGLTQAKIQ